MKFDELVQKRTGLLDQAEQILNLAADAQALTAEQETEVGKLHAEAETLKAQIDEMQAANDRAAAMQAKQEELRNAKLNPVVNRIAKKLTGAPAQPHNTVSEFKLPAQVRRESVKNFSGVDDSGMSPNERAYRFGQWALATASLTCPNLYNFSRSVEFCQENGLFNVHGVGGGDVSNAGIFVPEEFRADIIRLVENYGVARRLMDIEPMGSASKVVPRRVGGLTAYAVGENAAGTESDAEWNEVRLTAQKFMVLSRMSNELSEDSVIRIADRLVQEVGLAFALKEDQCAFNGDATSTYNGITGIRTRLDSLTAGTAPGLVLGAGNAYSELTLANFSSVVAALPEYAAANPAWVCHRTFFYSVMQPLALAAGGTTAGDIVNGVPARFLGFPVYFSQVFPSTAANSQIPVIFGDMMMGGLFGDRRQMSIAFSDTATVGGQSMWERDQIGIKATERFDIVWHDYGTNSVAGPICGLEMAGS